MNPETPDIKQPSKPNVIYIVFAIAIIVALLIFTGVNIYNHYHKNKTPVASTGTTAPIDDSITANGFSPSTISVNVGQSVVWTNYDTKSHSVSSDPFPTDNGLSGFKSQPLSSAQTYTFVFDQKGTFNYHDDLNPTTFKGTVVVK